MLRNSVRDVPSLRAGAEWGAEVRTMTAKRQDVMIGGGTDRLALVCTRFFSCLLQQSQKRERGEETGEVWVEREGRQSVTRGTRVGFNRKECSFLCSLVFGSPLSCASSRLSDRKGYRSGRTLGRQRAW